MPNPGDLYGTAIVIMFKFIKLCLVALIATASFALASCSEDKDDPISNEIVGTWKLTKVSTDGETYINWPYQTTTATFSSDGTYQGKGYFGNGSGTWKQKGKKIYTYVSGEEYIVYEVIDVNSSSCTLRMGVSGSDAKLYIKCNKQ